MSRRQLAGALSATALGAIVLSVGGATRPADAAQSESCNHTSPVVLPEPDFTRGESNTIRWEHVPKSCWIGEDNSGKASTDRRFTVRITNPASGRTASVTVNGEDEVDATIDANELPRGPNGEIDGVRFAYVVVRKEKWCSSGSPVFGTCDAVATRTSHPPSAAVGSTQDTGRPSGSLELAGEAAFVRSLNVPAQITATDPGGFGASGPGYVEFGASAQFGACRRSCVQSLDRPVTVLLEPGPDGVRTVHARVYDRARRANDDPGVTAFGLPPGNVSLPFTGIVILDRQPPQVVARASTIRATVGVPVRVDASESVDRGVAPSGIAPSSARWAFGDGSSAPGLATTHAYAAAGTYTVSIAVSDGVGNVARVDLFEITVVAAPVPPLPQTSTPPAQAPAPAKADRTPPTLSAVSLRRRGARTILAFRASERGTLVVEARRISPRPQRTLGSFKRAIRGGRQELALPPALARRLRVSGRYRVILGARDAAGNVGRMRFIALRTR